MSAPHGMGPPIRRKKPRRKTSEQDFQRQVAEYLGEPVRALPANAWFTSIPAGWGSMTKVPGYRAGTPDVLVIDRGLPIWLELKVEGREPSDEQEQCRDDLIAAGCKWVLVRTLEDVERALRRFAVPLRATVAA